MRRAEADMEYARMCPNTLHLFPESVRRPLRNLVDGVCPRRSANRKLHASEFQVFTVKYFISTTEHSGYCACATCCNVTEPCSFPAWCVDVFCTILTTCMYICRFQNVVLRCPTPRLHCFLSSHWPSFRFLLFVAFLIPSIQFFFGLPRALFCFSIHFSTVLGNLPSAILWTWPYHVSWFCSIYFIIGSSNTICCLIVTFLILSFPDILEDLLRASISVASTRLLVFSVILYVSEPYNKLLLINAL